MQIRTILARQHLLHEPRQSDKDLQAVFAATARNSRPVYYLGRGEHVYRYRLRAETPGRFRALPATGFAMYAPEIRATSDEGVLAIGE